MKIIKLFILGFIIGGFIALAINQVISFDKDVSDVLNEFTMPIMIHGDV